MKKNIFLSAIALSLLVFGCDSKATEQETDATTGTETATTQQTEETTALANEPKTYAVTFTPDTALLGKKKEAGIKLLPGTATELADPDGTAQGMELTFTISLTNKNEIGGNRIGVSPSDFRLVLEDGTSISQSSGGYVGVDSESTQQSEDITYRLPAGAKPKSLTLFYDETRASVNVDMK